MVNFDTRIFTEQSGQTIGCEVTVYSDQGDRIGNISVTDAESINELQQRLAVIDETYFTEARLATILENSQETNDINATSLSGFISSDFAKVSDLSAYALTNHTHSKSQITDLYDYQITASSYNVDIEDSVNIIVKVTNRATGNPVVGVTVPVLKNNETWQSGTTGVNGTFSLSYSTDTWGLITFSANNTNIQIRVKGWKQYNALNDTTNYEVYYNEDYVNVLVHTSSAEVTTSWNGWHNLLQDTFIKPAEPVTAFDTTGDILMKCSDNDSKIVFRTLSGTINRYIYGSLFWKRR